MSAGVIAASYVATKSYSAEILADSPLAYWRLGEAAGSSQSFDSSGNGHTLNAPGGTWNLGATGLLVGDSNTALSTTNMTAGGFNTPTGTWMNAPTFTVTALIKATSVAALGWIVGRDNTGASLSWRLWHGGAPQFIVNIGGTNKFASGATTFVVGTTYLVQARYTGSAVQLYLSTAANPVPTLDGSSAASGTPVYQQDIRIGADAVGSNDFVGTIDEVAYFGTSLSDARLAAHAAAAFGI